MDLGDYVAWHRSSNYGDLLAPWIYRRLTGRTPVDVDPGHPGWCITGSILGHGLRGVVWGCGAAWRSDLESIDPPSDGFSIIATRGPLSLEAARRRGHSPVAHGDPAFLLPFMIKESSKDIDLGIVVSWVDYDDMKSRFPGSHVICTNGSVEETVRQITRCKGIFSSTLHGLATAIAFGIPCRWVRFSGRMIGDDTKFHDLLLSLQQEVPSPLEHMEARDLLSPKLETYRIPHTLLVSLYQSCPFL